jgi:hypothetical protein
LPPQISKAQEDAVAVGEELEETRAGIQPATWPPQEDSAKEETKQQPEIPSLPAAAGDKQPESTPPHVEEERVKEEELYQDRTHRDGQLALDPKFRAQIFPGGFPRRPSSENITLQAYTELHRAKFDKVLELEKPDGWKLSTEQEGVKVYTKEMPGQKFIYFKGVSEIESKGGLFELMAKLFKVVERPQWDPMCADASDVQLYPPHYKIIHSTLLPPAPILATRDIYSIGRVRYEGDDAMVMAMESIESPPEWKEKPGIVRVNFLEGGYVVRPKLGEPGMFNIVWTGCVDPRGWVPIWVVNLTVVKQGLTLVQLKKHVAKK